MVKMEVKNPEIHKSSLDEIKVGEFFVKVLTGEDNVLYRKVASDMFEEVFLLPPWFVPLDSKRMTHIPLTHSAIIRLSP